MDWVAMSLAERIAPTKALYRAFMAVAKRQGIKGNLLLFQVLGGAEMGGTDYLSNFRKGKTDKHKARDIHLWLAHNHFDLAQDAAPDLFPYKPTDPFDDFIDEHAIMGKLRIVRIKNKIGLVERSDTSREDVETLRLSEKFCFELETGVDGIALAFQKYQGQWHPLPLGADQWRHTADVTQGINILPRTADRKPIPLEENDDAGRHSFVVIVSQERDINIDTRVLTRNLPLLENSEAHVVTLRFTT